LNYGVELGSEETLDPGDQEEEDEAGEEGTTVNIAGVSGYSFQFVHVSPLIKNFCRVPLLLL